MLVEFGPTHLDRAGVSVENWLAEMLAPNFTAYEVDESDGSLRPLRAKAELRAVFSVNLLLLRQPPLPSRRCASYDVARSRRCV